MTDTELQAALVVSPWDAMQRQADEHTYQVALRERDQAALHAFLHPGNYASCRLECAQVALKRAERRLGK